MTTMNNEDQADPSVHEPRELPESAAWRVYFPDEQREEFASSLDDLLDDLTNCAHDDPEPLYTADQMRSAVEAERERWSRLTTELVAIAETSALPDGDGVNTPTLLWAEEWARRLARRITRVAGGET